MTEGLRELAEIQDQQARHWQERILAEIAYAEGLLAREKTPPAGWAEAIAAARQEMEKAFRTGGDLESAVRRAEEALAPFGKAAKSLTIHCIGHAHIDMNWMWSWPETVSLTLDTFSTVLRLMEEYPDFTFSQSQASVYEIVERHHPAMLKRIAERVREGRWEVTASHWVEGDKNLANGESLTRHVLLTRAYMKKLFGLLPEDVPVDWAPDTFGHAATVPNYLCAAGVRFCYMHRPGIYTDHHEAFRWQGTDGSEILVYNDMKLGYNGVATPAVAAHCLTFTSATGGTDYPFLYGVGDHGGGPTRRDLEMIEEMESWPVFPRVKFSTARRFFEALDVGRKKLPLITGELNTEFTGCYTTQSLIKKVNRISENRLFDSEFAAVLANSAAGRPYPVARLESSWREALFTHFHDILPGSGVHDTRTYTHGMFQRVIADLAMEETQALRAIAERINTAEIAHTPPAGLRPVSRLRSGLGGGAGVWAANGRLTTAELAHDHGDRPFVLFNTTAAERREVVEVTLWEDAPPHAFQPLGNLAFEVNYPDGTLLPAQKTGNGAHWGHPYVTVAFPVVVPPCGYTAVVVRESTKERPAGAGFTPESARFLGKEHHCFYTFIERRRHAMENALLAVELDPETGGIARLTDKRTGLTCLDPAVSKSILQYGVELPHPMSSWTLDHTRGWEALKVNAIRITQRGPYRTSIEVDLVVAESSFCVIYSLDAGSPALRIEIRGTWFQRGSEATGVPTLRMSLPLGLVQARARYEIPFGGITRPLHQGEEQPALQWVKVTGKQAGQEGGVLLCNDSKYGYSLDGSTLNATLIHASYNPDPLPEIGQHEMTFRLQPFTGVLSDAAAVAAARALNHPLRIVGAGIQKGELPLTAAAVRTEKEGVILSGLKRSEDGRGLILRFYETTGAECRTLITLNSLLLGSFAGVEAVDLMERPVTGVKVSLAGETITLTLPANGLVTLRLKSL